MNNDDKRPGLGHNRALKTAAERQKDHYDRRKDEGWRKGWIDPVTLARVKDLGGIEHVAAQHDRLAEVVEQQAELIADQMNALEKLAGERDAALQRSQPNWIKQTILSLIGK